MQFASVEYNHSQSSPQMRNTHLLVFIFACLYTASTAKYLIGQQGQSCYDACFAAGLNCNPVITTKNDTSVFQQLGVNCKANPKPWWAEDQPSYVSDPSDPNYGECVGYVDVPASVGCVGSYPTTRRLCNCDDPNTASHTAAFGSGYSGGFVSKDERTMFAFVLPNGVNGAMTHFWSTAPYPVLEETIIRYYVDGETTPSIQYYPPQACGAGFNDQHNPWGTNWFGKGAKDGAWFNNFRIPFTKSVRVTAQHVNGTQGGFYIILRGSSCHLSPSLIIPTGMPNLSINIGGVAVPPQAKLLLNVFDKDVKPLEWVPIADVPAGKKGLFFMHTLAVKSGNLNFLEGCYHQEFPGTLLSTGTEDYFDSAWYFNGGQFWLPVSGFTHFQQDSKQVTWSGDPLPFDDGFLLHWRNGDVLDPAGRKCYAQTGTIVGTPTVSHVTSYAWVYVW